MKGTSKVIMGATLVMVLSLAIVLGLVLVLLAELYCSLLLRRRQIKLSKNPVTTPTPAASTAYRETQFPSPLSSFYAQGVLRAPRSLLFPSLAAIRDDAINADVEGQHGKLHEFLSLQTALESDKADQSTAALPDGGKEQLVYISNPVYDNDAARSSGGRGDHTPFETPDTSPSRLEDKELATATTTPPLTPMKELPAKTRSVAMSVGTSGSESNSQNAAFSPTTYTGSPSCTSSW